MVVNCNDANTQVISVKRERKALSLINYLSKKDLLDVMLNNEFLLLLRYKYMYTIHLSDYQLM